ncbi:hypothetical protein Rctr197k_040 [Virus Rctr197k]|nr:hypothetical protein Rctr197k_040 [Virus Rctr197k]
MALSQILISNLTTGSLSIDIKLDPKRVIRELLPLGGSVDVSAVATLDELNRNTTVRLLRGVDPVATPKISVTQVVAAGDDDIEGTTTQEVSTLVSPDNHMVLNTLTAGRTIRLNSQTTTDTASSFIGFQAKPGRGASSTENVIGGEISPRLNSAVALTGSGSIIGLHVDAYLRGSAGGDIAGDVRGMQIELVDDNAAGRTISGNAIGIRFRSNLSCTAITGQHTVLSVENGEGSQKWDQLAVIESEAGVFDDTTAVNATQNGYIAVMVNGQQRYIPLYTGHV